MVIDGRIADLVATGVFDNQLIMPRFALSELQAIADSGDKLRRTRGRRGLDVLNRMRADDNVDLMIFDRELPELAGQTVDLKLVLLAKHLEGKVVTGDFNLNKIAKLQNVPVMCTYYGIVLWELSTYALPLEKGCSPHGTATVEARLYPDLRTSALRAIDSSRVGGT